VGKHFLILSSLCNYFVKIILFLKLLNKTLDFDFSFRLTV
jgi:hypothetical protein